MSCQTVDITVGAGMNATSTSAPATASVKSPWASINDVLIQNRCWLCLNYFPKGKTKKVFQVSDLLTFYHNHMSRLIIRSEAAAEASSATAAIAFPLEGDAKEHNSETVTPAEDKSSEVSSECASEIEPTSTDYKFISANLQACYDSYVALMNAGDGKPDLLFKEFKETDVEVWMSGLVCAISADCRKEAAYFIENKKHAASTADGKRKVNSMFAFSIPNGTDCPPGCGCDNPWPFMP